MAARVVAYPSTTSGRNWSSRARRASGPSRVAMVCCSINPSFTHQARSLAFELRTLTRRSRQRIP